MPMNNTSRRLTRGELQILQMLWREQQVTIARAHHDVAKYQAVEIHLYWPDPEQEIHEHVLTRAP